MDVDKSKSPTAVQMAAADKYLGDLRIEWHQELSDLTRVVLVGALIHEFGQIEQKGLSPGSFPAARAEIANLCSGAIELFGARDENINPAEFACALRDFALASDNEHVREALLTVCAKLQEDVLVN